MLLQERDLRSLCVAGSCAGLGTSQVLRVNAGWLELGEEGSDTTAAGLNLPVREHRRAGLKSPLSRSHAHEF